MRLALLATPLLALAACGPDAGRAPDVLLVSIDTLRADRLSCYGAEHATTPFLDSVAAEGVRFESAHAPATNTTPSHMSLFTGLDPMTHGVHPSRPSNKPTAALSERAVTLPQALRSAGWRTAAFTDRGGLPPSAGFGRGFEHLRSEWESLAEKVDACGEYLEAAPDEPLFVFFHTYEVHAPYLPPPSLHGRFADAGYRGPFRHRYESVAGLPVDEAWDKKAQFLAPFDDMTDGDLEFLSALYDEGVAWTDRQLERLWERWSAARGPDGTLLVVLSDHGEEFREHDRLGHKLSLHAELVRVPLIFRGPGIGSHVVETPVSLTGVFPTILDYCGLDVPRYVQVPSFLRVLRDPAAGEALPPVFTQTDNKLDRRYESVTVGDRRLLRITVKGDERVRLYDWNDDPLEQRDLSEERPADVEELLPLLDARREEAGRLRRGLGPNPQHVLSPEEIEELRALGYTED